MAGALGAYAQEEAATDTLSAAERPANAIKKNVKNQFIKQLKQAIV